MRQWEGGGLLLVSPLGGWCVCECVVMDKAIDCGVWFLQQPVPTQGQRRTGREAQTAAVIDTSSQSDNALSAFHHVHLLFLQTNPTERVCVCVLWWMARLHFDNPWTRFSRHRSAAFIAQCQFILEQAFLMLLHHTTANIIAQRLHNCWLHNLARIALLCCKQSTFSWRLKAVFQRLK